MSILDIQGQSGAVFLLDSPLAVAAQAIPAKGEFQLGLTPNFCQAGVVAPPDSLIFEKTSVLAGR